MKETDIVKELLTTAKQYNASDIHIDPTSTCVRIRLRVDGLLRDVEPLATYTHAEVINRIKNLAGLRIDEHRLPQDGRFRYCITSNYELDVRVSIMPTHYGENAVLRVLRTDNNVLSLFELGMSESDQRRVLSALDLRSGLIIATGPTGSGKTTTLYALLQMLNTAESSIITLEDPIEYAIGGVRQIPISPTRGFGFAGGLKSVLRQDPDIIMVGEIRDSETASLAIQAALTGHLVLSTLHTTDALSSIVRLEDMGVAPYLIAATLKLVIGQRLVRKLCSYCFGEGLVDACNTCSLSGFSGRVGVYETLAVDGLFAEAIAKKQSFGVIEELAVRSGMTTMQSDGQQKIKDGLTTMMELERVLYEQR